MWKEHRWAVLGVLLAINVVAYIDRALLQGFAPAITKELSLSNTQFGFLAGVVWVLSFGVMAPFLGSLADRFSRPRIVAGGVFVWSACTAASGFAENFSQMAAARFMVAAGEAALVPAAMSLLAELFDEKRRGTANGVFFLGLPLGLGLAFLLSGTVGTTLGWRGTYMALGITGILIAAALAFFHEDRSSHAHERGEPFAAQFASVLREIRSKPVVALVIAGFVTIHLVLMENQFVQLWLVRERGMEAASSARTIGALQILLGCLGALGGGFLADRLAARFKGGRPALLALLVIVSVPLMIASRLVLPDSPLLTLGLAASFFLPLSVYGGALSLIQGNMPASMRATAIGFTMMSLNVFAVAAGSLLTGFISDRLAASGHPSPLTTVMLTIDVIVGIVAVTVFLIAAKLVAAGRAVPDAATAVQPGETSSPAR